MEEAFLEACFEEMLQEEESQWCHYTLMPLQAIQYTTYMPNMQFTTYNSIVQYPTHMPTGQQYDGTTVYSGNIASFNFIEQYTNEQPRYCSVSKNIARKLLSENF